MHVSINDKKENILLGRTEVKGKIDFEGATPTNVKVAEAIAHQTKSDIGLVFIHHIHTKFGKEEAAFVAYVYADAAAKKRSTRITSHIRKKIEEEKKKAGEKKEGEQ